MGFVDCLHCKLDVPYTILMTMLLYWFLVLFCINITSIKSRKQFCLTILRYLILHLTVYLTIIVLHSWTMTHRIIRMFPYPTPNPNRITTAITTPTPQVLNTVQQQQWNKYNLATGYKWNPNRKPKGYNVEPLDSQTIFEVLLD